MEGNKELQKEQMEGNTELQKEQMEGNVELLSDNVGKVHGLEFDEMSAKKDDEPVKATAEKAKWGNKTVTRQFLIMVIAATVLVNAALAAGITGVLLKKQAEDRSELRGNGRPGNEIFFDNNQNGRGNMSPPGGDQNNDQSQEQSSKVSIGIVIKDDSGVYVTQVNGENAKKAGFKEGDKVVSIEGKNITSSNDLISEVQTHKAGDTVAVTVERDGKTVEIKTELE